MELLNTAGIWQELLSQLLPLLALPASPCHASAANYGSDYSTWGATDKCANASAKVSGCQDIPELSVPADPGVTLRSRHRPPTNSTASGPSTISVTRLVAIE
jgi:hypothetical protein